MLSVSEVIKKRRSVRKYFDKPVEITKLEKVLESACLAPSGSNTQPWKFIVIKSKEKRKELAKASHNQLWMIEAPVFIACVADISVRIEDSRELNLHETTDLVELKQIIRDTSISIDHLVLEAESQGLSTCWIAWYEQEDIRPLLGIPNDKYVLAIITLGYGNEKNNSRPRKNIEDLVFYEKWDNKVK